MPLHGRMLDVAELIYGVSGTATYSHSGTIGTADVAWNGTAESFYTPNTVLVTRGVKLTIASQSDPAQTTVFVDCPGSPIGGETLVVSASYSASASAELRFKNFKAYGRAFLDVLLVWTGLELWVNGAYVKDYGAGEHFSAGVGPAYMPFIGIEPTISPSVTAIIDDLPGVLPTTYSWGVEASVTVLGGWRLKHLDGTYSTGPVNLPPIVVPGAGSCPFGLSYPSVTDGQTWQFPVTAYHLASQAKELIGTFTGTAIVRAYCRNVLIYEAEGPAECVGGSDVEIYRTTTIDQRNGSTVQVTPNPPRGIRRMDEGHAQMVYRWGMPKTEYNATRLCETDGVSVGHSLEGEVHPSQSEILSVIGDTAHACEDTLLDYEGYAPVALSAEKTESQDVVYVPLHGACSCPPSWVPVEEIEEECDTGHLVWHCEMVYPLYEGHDYSETLSFDFPSLVEDELAQPDLAPYLLHLSPRARYSNTWLNPIWSYANWFPANTIDSDGDGNPDQQNEWPVQLLPIAKEYWMDLGDQYLSHASLPPAENRQSRTTNFSDCLNTTGWQLFCESYRGQLPFIGISRWRTQEVTPLPEFIYTEGEETLFTGEDCIVSPNATNIVITPI